MIAKIGRQIDVGPFPFLGRRKPYEPGPSMNLPQDPPRASTGRSTIPIPLPTRVRNLFRRWTPTLIFLTVAALCGGLWREHVSPSSCVGTVETLRALVTCPDDGTLTNVWVTLHQEVKEGAVVAEVVTTDPRTVNSRLSVMRGRMQLTELEMSPVMSQQRNAIDYAQLTLSAKRLKVEVETARVNLSRAEADLERYRKLHKNGLISDEALLVYQRLREALDIEVQEKGTLLKEMEKTLERLSFLADSFIPGSENDPLRQAIKVQEAQTRALEDRIRPLPLLSPMDGIVTAVYRRRGEQLIAGLPVAEITSAKVERIVGQLPQSVPFSPEVGMAVRVQTRGVHRRVGQAQIIGLSPHLEVDTNTVGRTASAFPYRVFSVSLPTNMALLPGETVELTLLPKPGH